MAPPLFFVLRSIWMIWGLLGLLLGLEMLIVTGQVFLFFVYVTALVGEVYVAIGSSLLHCLRESQMGSGDRPGSYWQLDCADFGDARSSLLRPGVW